MNGLVVSAVGLAILKSEVRQTKYYCSFWVESIPILWVMSIFILDMFQLLKR